MFSVIATLAEINSSRRLVNTSLIFQLGSNKLVPSKVKKYQKRKVGSEVKFWEKSILPLTCTKKKILCSTVNKCQRKKKTQGDNLTSMIKQTYNKIICPDRSFGASGNVWPYKKLHYFQLHRRNWEYTISVKSLQKKHLLFLP